jgi:hypothetical protein
MIRAWSGSPGLGSWGLLEHTISHGWHISAYLDWFARIAIPSLNVDKNFAEAGLWTAGKYQSG